MFEELFVFAKVGQDKQFAGQKKESSLRTSIFMPEEMLIDKVGYLKFVVDIVGHAVVSNVANQFIFEFHVLKCVLQIV